jgi:hypothetical protein
MGKYDMEIFNVGGSGGKRERVEYYKVVNDGIYDLRKLK